jgi:hypothetical protein
MMVRSWVVPVAATAMLWAGSARAVSTETQLTPKALKVNGLVFQITAEGGAESKTIEVVVKADMGRELSPYLSALLELYDGKRLVISCPVENKGRAGELRYRFTVSARDAGKVRFQFNEYAFARITDKNNETKIIPMPAVDRYWLDLKDFVGGK